MLVAALAFLLAAAPAPEPKPVWAPASPELMSEGWAEGAGWKTTTLDLDGVPIRILLGPAEHAAATDAQILDWVRTCARAVAGTFGRFPVKDLIIRFERDGDGGGVSNGVTYQGRRIRIDLGLATTPADLAEDWVLTHEMFHLGFPDVDEEYHYLEEGLSTYLEPIARTRLGVLPAEDTWKSFVDGFPKGLPRAGDQGLDHTPTWGNTYWGGARFWLLADLEIRERTHGAKSLDDALKAILAAGGDGSVHWDLARVLKVADEATGTSVLTELHRKLGNRPVQTDLAALWKKLGVRGGAKITFDDSAPGAALRKAIAK